MLDLAPGALQHLLLLLVRLVDHLRSNFFTDLTALGDDPLRFVARGFDLPLLLGERLSGSLAIALRPFDRFLERLLTRFDGGGDFGEDQLAEDDQQDDEGDERPEHQPAVGREKIAGLPRFFGRNLRCLEKCKNGIQH